MRLTSILALTTLFSAAVVDSVAIACSCMEPSVEDSFETSTDVMVVRIRGRRVVEEELIYSAQVGRTLKGCTERGDDILLATASSSATCGATNLRPGQTYLIFGDDSGTLRDRAVFDINLCDDNQLVRELTRAEIRFLKRNAEECDIGEPICEAYEVDEFGSCDMFLGYSVQAETGRCGGISGCGAPPEADIFDSLEECQTSCMAD